jgi:5,10-methylenetetrahydrofolate reductase
VEADRIALPPPRRDRFLTVVEVFPPSFSAAEDRDRVSGVGQKIREFVAGVDRIRSLADLILVADVKDPTRVQLSSVYSAALLREKIGVEAMPVIVARDSNRHAILSSIVSLPSLRLNNVMLVWGDRYAESESSSNVYDFRSLSELIAHTRRLAQRSKTKCTVFAPINLSSLESGRGAALALSRLKSGADFLLAQPPTTDVSASLDRHEVILTKLGLKKHVLPSVFLFRDAEDIRACRAKFGWEIPEGLVEVARGGEPALLRQARKVAQAIRERGFPGVYVSTRGRPELALRVLGSKTS